MTKALSTLFGSVVAVALMVTAIWAWFDAAPLAMSLPKGEVLKWAARCLAIAAAAGAQVVLITFVLGRLYQFRSLHEGLRLTAAIVCCVAAVSAAALGLVAQG